ncbi:hypothetical protein V5P93_002052 [Actinokineospora auranticolor]|uniref:Uncharacterized protein n=1 Tax=Actinokineospora auranticolor TaxID=155976 RepID=A0A2S6GCI2_9PSEU|nr:hypothetical protein [Actinokineospora auranticolor]PPK62558.1 hypothetical protein CLV40_13420 [Actinokineospora auranticolor]
MAGGRQRELWLATAATAVVAVTALVIAGAGDEPAGAAPGDPAIPTPGVGCPPPRAPFPPEPDFGRDQVGPPGPLLPATPPDTVWICATRAEHTMPAREVREKTAELVKTINDLPAPWPDACTAMGGSQFDLVFQYGPDRVVVEVDLSGCGPMRVGRWYRAGGRALAKVLQ